MKKIIFIAILSTISMCNNTFGMEQQNFPSYLDVFKKKSAQILTLGSLLSGTMYTYSHLRKQFLKNRIFSYVIVPFGTAYCIAHSSEMNEHTNKEIKTFIENKKQELND